MKRKVFIAALALFVCTGIFAKENLAILPFTGGQGEEGETIAELFSFNNQLNAVFSPIPRTSITQAVKREQGFQLGSGMTDADTIVAIGQQLGARYVVAGNITSIGNNKLLVIAIMDIRNLQQIAGDYQSYNNLTEIRGKLPNMAANIIQATQKNTSKLPKLAVPVQVFGDVDQNIADTLTQILAINLIKSGKYSVYPRTKSLEQVMEEHITQTSGITADSNIVGFGYGENPNLVLSVVARKLEDINMFNAVILNLLTGAQVAGDSVEYKTINDGINAMETLSFLLTSTPTEIDRWRQEEEKHRLAENQKRIKEQQEEEKRRLAENQRRIKQQQEEEKRRLAENKRWIKQQKAAERKEARKKFWAKKAKDSKRNYYEYAFGYFQWGEGLIGGGGSILTSIHWTFIPFFNIGIETRFGFLSHYDGEEARFFFSGSPTLGLAIPINENVKIFGDAVLELGRFGGLKGTITDWVTPAYDCGILFDWKSDLLTGLEIKYRGTWYDGHYAHSIGIGILFFEFAKN